MKHYFVVLAQLLAVLIVLNGCTRRADSPGMKGPYLGQVPPSMTPEVFAPETVSTRDDEINAVFSVDGKEFYFSRDTHRDVSRAGRDYTIMFMKESMNGWTEPRVASFAGDYMNADMFMTRGDGYLLYCSDRPVDMDGPRNEDADIWVVERIEDRWSEPRNLGPAVNSESNEWYPTTTLDGTLYFSSPREGGFGGPDIYRSRFEDGRYLAAENIGAPVNTQYNEGDVFIAPDGRYLIVVSSNRPDGLGSGDLYVAFRKHDGTWTEPRNIGAPVNSDALEYCPMVSPDGKYLFFTSRRSGNDDLYWVDAGVIEKSKPDELK
jgi:hypothetical protein